MKCFLPFFFFGFALGAWQDGVQIKSRLHRDQLSELGTFSGHPEDHLNVLKWTSEDVYVGGRDKLYRLSTSDLTKKSALSWPVSQEHRSQCEIKGQPESECHNYLRVFHGPLPNPHRQLMKREDRTSSSASNETAATNSTRNAKAIGQGRINDDGFIVCGTNAFKPSCRYYNAQMSNFSQEFSGVGYTSFDPTHRSTSVLHQGAVYAATVADFGGTDALIYKNPMRTEQYDLRHFNQPNFISSASWGDYAFFFFREFAIEHMNCGKAVFSRVARICRHDHGTRKHRDRFTTFLKARLNCSVPGEFPFYFDHITGTTDIFKNNATGDEMLYAVFTTPPNSIGGSAVCAFSMNNIVKAFNGAFKGQSSYNSNWLPVPTKDLPEPNLSRCQEHNEADGGHHQHGPSANTVAFLKDHPLMDESVQGQLVMTRPSHVDRFNVIEVDRSGETDEAYHILYVGTESGKVLKAVINSSLGESFSPEHSVISQSWDVFPGKPIKSLRLVGPKRLLVTSETSAVLLKVDNCAQFKSCRECLALQDPHCAWASDNHECVARNSDEARKADSLIQDVAAGDTNLCLAELPVEANNDVAALEPLRRVESSSPGAPIEKPCDCSSDASSVLSANLPDPLDTNHIGQARTFLQDDQETEELIHQNRVIPQQPEFGRVSPSTQDPAGLYGANSVIAATVSSGALSLLVGFTVGFVLARWMGARHNKTKDSSTNAQQMSANETQRLTTKPIDYVVNVPSANKNPLKNNLNSETLEKKVKKMYI